MDQKPCNANFLELRECEVQHTPAQTAQEETSSNPPRTPEGPSSSNDPRLLLVLVDPVDAAVGAPEVAIGVVHLFDACDLPQKLASGLSKFL
jgi:hypothetical protein